MQDSNLFQAKLQPSEAHRGASKIVAGRGFRQRKTAKMAFVSHCTHETTLADRICLQCVCNN
jgi:hypothetical protein